MTLTYVTETKEAARRPQEVPEANQCRPGERATNGKEASAGGKERVSLPFRRLFSPFSPGIWLPRLYFAVWVCVYCVFVCA